VGLLEMADIEIFPVAGDEFSYTQDLELEARSRINVEIVNRYGSIDVLPSEDDSIRVDVQKTVIAANQDDADRLAGLLTFSILEEVPAYRVVSSFRRDSNSVRGRRIRTSLVVRVPRQSSVRIDNRDGYVRVSDLTGGQSIVNAAGNVEVRNLTGDLTVRNSGGEVDVEAVSGSAVVVNAFDAVRIRTVGGDLELSSRNADVQVTGVGGGVEITNSFARTEVSGIAGDLTVRGRNNAVEISDIGGDTDVESSFEDIRIYDARGLIRVDNRNGDIELRFPTQPQGNVTVETEFSEVTFELPLTSSFRADLRTRIGEVETDFALPITTERPEQWTVGVAGQGGPTLRVRTRNGDIRLTGL
jgi:DUF4097 and DUF4098 domain-containing protein YvlB